MRRTSVMTLGFVLIFIGIQLHLVDSFVLTQRISNFLSDPVEVQANSQFVGQGNWPNQNNPTFSQTSFPTAQTNQFPNLTKQQPKVFSPPSWLCWPFLFLGTVVFLHGFSMRRV
ncbi:MAG: hypothetical protein AAF939_11180 [Planctomycetota bacterium]